MQTTVERIKELIPSLPSRDIKLGYKFLEERNFRSLKELVDSAYYKVRKDRREDINSYPEVDLINLFYLKGEVESYCAVLELDVESELDDYTNFDNIDYEIS